MYIQGGPLVNYILERFGPERFLQLYTTCRRRTIATDVSRILGLSLDELDAAVWADIERRVPREDRSVPGRLARFVLGPGVERAEWQTFVSEYGSALDRLRKPFEQVRILLLWNHSTTGREGQPTHFRCRVRLVRSDDSFILRSDFPLGYGQIDVAHPRQSFLARRESLDAPWVVEDDPTAGAAGRYRRALRRINEFWFEDVTVPSLTFGIGLGDEPSRVVVEEFQRFSEEDRQYLKLRLLDHGPNESGKDRVLTFVLAVDDFYTVRSAQIEDADGLTRGTFTYEMRGALPVLTAHHASTTKKDGSQTTLRWTVAERTFEATPQSEFTPERVLDGAVVHTVVSHPSGYESAAAVRRWYGIPLVFGTLALGGGAALALGSLRLHRRFAGGVTPS
jgi:hypothetical protein